MRTWPEIIAFCERQEKEWGLFSFARDVAANYAPAEQLGALGYEIKPGAEIEQRPLTRKQLLADMTDYLAFAWVKAEDHRGLSAIRSIHKLSTWLYLLEDDEAVAFVTDDEHYAPYGAPALKYIAERYKLPFPESPQLSRMVEGKSCIPGCKSCLSGSSES